MGLADRELVGIVRNFHEPIPQHLSAVVYVIDFKNCLPLLHSHAPHGRIYEYALVCVQVGGLELVYYTQWNYHLQRQRTRSHYKLVHVAIVTGYTCLKPLLTCLLMQRNLLLS